jgi:hypothetical protein
MRKFSLVALGETSRRMGRTPDDHLLTRIYYLSTLLALHHFAARWGRPLPKFLTVDQPTQVYFPSEQIYKDADGSIERTEEDADLAAVRRLFA